MKFRKILGIIGFTAILSLLLSVIPAMPAMAANDISVDPTSGKIGDEISITGDTFTQYKTTGDYEYWAEVYFAKDSVALNTDIENAETYLFVAESNDPIDSNGDWETTFTVPTRLTGGSVDQDVDPGTYYVYVTIQRINNDTGANIDSRTNKRSNQI